MLFSGGMDLSGWKQGFLISINEQGDPTLIVGNFKILLAEDFFLG